MLTSIARKITNEYISKLKIRYKKLGDWLIVNKVLYEKTLKQSMVDKKTDEKEAGELKKTQNHYLDKRKGIMRSASLKVEDISGDILSKGYISPEQKTKPNNFLASIM